MIDLARQMSDSYSDHPQFRFSQQEWTLADPLLADFVDLYETVGTFRASLSSRQFVTLKRDAIECLRAIFASLEHQASDEPEIRFIAELRHESERLLIEELDHLHAGIRAGCAELPTPGARADALRLSRDRHFFGSLSSAATDEIVAISARDVVALRNNAERGLLKREDLSVNSGPTIRRIIQVLNREYGSLGVLDAISAYAGARMSVTGLALELSVPQATWWNDAFGGAAPAPRTLYAHVDESIKYPKSIVYLSAVNEDNGPTSCYPHAYEALQLNPLQEIVGRIVANVGNAPASPLRTHYAKRYHQSMSSQKFREHFMRLPSSMRFNSHLGWDVRASSELEQSLVDAETVMTGSPGTYIVFDGARLLHRGGMVRQGDRLALQVVFSDQTGMDRVANKLKRVLK